MRTLPDELRAFQLVASQYEELVLAQTKVWIPEFKLGLGLWQGEYRRLPRLWLRWYNEQGNWVLTEAELERGSGRLHPLRANGRLGHVDR